MSKSLMKPEFAALERDIIETLLAGHHSVRPDLAYPESHSDMQSGVRALLVMFDIKRRPLALDRAELYDEDPCYSKYK